MTKNGLVVDGEGWFVINARESRWDDWGPLGFCCDFEGKKRFPQLGININVLQPGQAMGMYHRENSQEGFLVLTGECVLVVEEQERRLRAWDFFHCPGGTQHILVGAGEETSVVVAVGARGRGLAAGSCIPSPRLQPVTAQASRMRRRDQPRRTRRYGLTCRGRPSFRIGQASCPTPFIEGLTRRDRALIISLPGTARAFPVATDKERRKLSLVAKRRSGR